MLFNPLSANPRKWPTTLKQFVGKLPTNCFSLFDHFVKLALKGLKKMLNPFHATGLFPCSNREYRKRLSGMKLFNVQVMLVFEIIFKGVILLISEAAFQ